jgi:NADH dehydrogenase
MHGFRAGGVVGWLAWGLVHLTFLTGFANRFSAVSHWLRSALGSGRSQLSYSARFERPSHTR